MAMNAGWMTWEYSGGSGNSDPDASLGGEASGVEVDSQDASAPSNVTGVTIRYAAGNKTGDGTLSYDSNNDALSWKEADGDAGPDVGMGEDDRFTLWTGDGEGGEGDGYVVVEVTYSDLPSDDQSDTIAVSQIDNNIWDDVTKSEAVYGDTEYRCLYLYNRFDETLLDVRVWVESQPVGEDELDLGLDPTGIGDGTSSGVAQTIDDEGNPPDNVTWDRPSDYSSGIEVGDLEPDECIAVWLRREVPSGTSTVEPEDLSRIGFGAQY